MEKREYKISLSTFFLILAIISILVMGYAIYNLSNQKVQNDIKVANLEEKVSQLEKSENIVNKNDTKLDKEENNLVPSETNEHDEKTETKKIPELTDKQAKELIKKYLLICGTYEGSPIEMVYYELYGESEIKTNENKKIKEDEDTEYIATNKKYSDYKNRMRKYMSEELFEKFKNYRNVNGILYALDAGATGGGYSDFKVKLKTSKDNVYTYTGTALQYPPEDGEKISFTFKIKYDKDHYVISDFVV